MGCHFRMSYNLHFFNESFSIGAKKPNFTLMQEIERKFLVVNNDFMKSAVEAQSIEQGYLSLDPDRTVRVRLQNGKGFLTIKGKSSEDGTTRMEWEIAMSEAEAKSLLTLCLGNLIVKTRYKIPVKSHCFEVDVFEAPFGGLVLAEIELEDVADKFEKPSWLGKEVTGDVRYYNARMASGDSGLETPSV